jgi:two-component system chemotaxis response regulator CheY
MFDPKTKILVIDDMRTMRKIVIKALKEMGFEQITEAEDGAQGWNALSTPNADIGLVISDWNMPNCTGIDLLRRVRGDSRFSKLPFVLVTAESEKQQVVEAITIGASAYVVKPFDTGTLKGKLAEAYGKKAV